MKKVLGKTSLYGAVLALPVMLGAGSATAADSPVPAPAAATSPVATGTLDAAEASLPGVSVKRKRHRKPPLVSRSESPFRYGTVRYSKWYARQYMAKKYGWNVGQFKALEELWYHESRWLHRVGNSSGAYGIPQALPGSKMRSAGSDWQTNPETQIRWGLGYIKGRYGSPSRALGHWGSYNWY